MAARDAGRSFQSHPGSWHTLNIARFLLSTATFAENAAGELFVADFFSGELDMMTAISCQLSAISFLIPLYLDFSGLELIPTPDTRQPTPDSRHPTPDS